MTIPLFDHAALVFFFDVLERTLILNIFSYYGSANEMLREKCFLGFL